MKKLNYKFLVFIILTFVTGCKSLSKTDISQTAKSNYTEEELYRPRFHFTPKENWMNDPNGLYYLNGSYHMFFQYYPSSTVWGPMHWGHAISSDLIKWKELPIALYPDEKGYIFSGSAVVDVNNTSGFRKGEIAPVIAIFTYHDPKIEKEGKINYQSQGIAYSLDEGLTWTKYTENPVIKNPGIKDFRDPKVFRDTINNQWVLVLAAGNKSMFYRSINLIDWEYLSDFGEGIGAHGGVWECPDFFSLTVDGTDEVKWVLIQSLVSGGPNGGSGTQYFVGDFDGKTFSLDSSFKNDLNLEKVFWIDNGRDNYAGVTWSNIPEADGRKLFLGWMSNWEYAEKVPTHKWRSSMTIPRELILVKTDNHYRIESKPVKEVNKYFSTSIIKANLIIDKEAILANNSEIDFSSLDIKFKIKNITDDTYTFSLYNSIGDSINFGINNKEKNFFLDRTKSGNLSFSDKFAPNISTAIFKESCKNVDVRVLLDKTSIEIFYNNGKTVMTEIFFLQQPIESFSVKSDKFNFEIENLIINQFGINQN
ncbi:glycoside hydrolase family 32 protein [Mariniflexile soesokkakense]|uniref:Glycoside hydrolase family 32 protein n=1 Tax=Mariniflexile soesokkakense TaxID=1343160 RepID=A0ABV0ADV9_9FLAO